MAAALKRDGSTDVVQNGIGRVTAAFFLVRARDNKQQRAVTGIVTARCCVIDTVVRILVGYQINQTTLNGHN